MPSTLLLYATNSGNTYYVAHRIAETLKVEKVNVEIRAVGDVSPAIIDEFDTIIIGSCTWNKHTKTAKYEEGQLQDEMEKFVEALSGKKFKNKKFAVFGLGDSEYMRFCAAADHLERFVRGIGAAQLGKTLRIDSFPQAQDDLIDRWARELVPLLK